MDAKDIKVGTKIQCSGIFEIAKATETRLSWYTGLKYRSAFDKRTEKMAWCTRKQAQGYLDSGFWEIIDL